ncbi:MAG: FecR domain-containing protein [Gemmatimonadaceae bacterium]
MNDADWEALARYITGESSPDEVERLEARFAAQPADKKLLDTLAAVTRQMASAVPTDLDVEAALRRVKVRRKESATRPLEFRRPIVDARRPVRWHVPVPALAAAALLAVGVAGYLTMRTPKSALPVSPSAPMVATGVGVLDSLRLPDGTRIVIGPLSSVKVAAGYGVTSREVEVTGDAYFDVVHDPSRPFTAHALRATIQDLGTKFAVRTDAADGVSVSVTDGSVALQGRSPIRSGGNAPRGAIVLKPGEKGVVRSDGQTIRERAGPDDVAWMRHQLVFREAPLSEVAASLNRWYGIDLQVPDASLAARHLTATFSGESPERVLDVIRLVLGADIERHGDTAIVRAKR